MIEEVVNSILEAEDVAQKKIEAAKQEANEIIASAEKSADDFKKQTSAKNKTVFADGVKKIEQKAASSAEKILADMKNEAEAEMANYGKNVEKAVNIILEQLK